MDLGDYRGVAPPEPGTSCIRKTIDTFATGTYRGAMDIRPTNDPPDPDHATAGDEVPADAFSPVVDPDLTPGPSPDEKQAQSPHDEEQA